MFGGGVMDRKRKTSVKEEEDSGSKKLEIVIVCTFISNAIDF
jgi:hypothetical protein